MGDHERHRRSLKASAGRDSNLPIPSGQSRTIDSPPQFTIVGLSAGYAGKL
jgi:hypothetical protein